MNHIDFLTTYETDGKQTRWQSSSTSKVKIYQRSDNLVNFKRLNRYYEDVKLSQKCLTSQLIVKNRSKIWSTKNTQVFC